MKCRECGEEGTGNYCARCGAPLGAAGEEHCSSCGAELAPEAYYCTECGEPVQERPEKELGDYLPWILSGLALVAFAVGITLLVQEEASPRTGDAPPTGGVIESGGPEDAGGAGGVAPDRGGGMSGASGAGAPGGDAGGMPSAQELSQMSPRQAADRLFNRTMRLRSSGDEAGRAPFFARMGVRAYRRIPDSEVDADVRFHIGLLQLVQEAPDAAAAEADTILSEHPAHLLGLLLAARAAEARGAEEEARRWRDSLEAAGSRTSLDARPEYRAHESLLGEVAGDGSGGAGPAGG